MIAVAQLPPPITANFIFSVIFIKFNQKYLKLGWLNKKTVEDAISHRAMKTRVLELNYFILNYLTINMFFINVVTYYKLI
jgi:hypothetical protein